MLATDSVAGNANGDSADGLNAATFLCYAIVVASHPQLGGTPQVRARLSANALVAVASLTYAAVLAAVAASRSLALSVLVLLPAGVSWIALLSNVNAALQLFLPRWVRARGPAALRPPPAPSCGPGAPAMRQ